MKAIATKAAAAPFTYNLTGKVPASAAALVRQTGRQELNQSLRTDCIMVTLRTSPKHETTVMVVRDRDLTWADVVFDLHCNVKDLGITPVAPRLVGMDRIPQGFMGMTAFRATLA